MIKLFLNLFQLVLVYSFEFNHVLQSSETITLKSYLMTKVIKQPLPMSHSLPRSASLVMQPRTK